MARRRDGKEGWTQKQVDKCVKDIRNMIGPFIVNCFWPDMAKVWAKNAIGSKENKLGIFNFVLTIANGMGPNGEDLDSFGLRDYPDAKRLVAQTLLDDLRSES